MTWGVRRRGGKVQIHGVLRQHSDKCQHRHRQPLADIDLQRLRGPGQQERGGQHRATKQEQRLQRQQVDVPNSQHDAQAGQAQGQKQLD